MALKHSSARRKEYLRTALPYSVKINNIDVSRYNQLVGWVAENVSDNEYQVPSYRKSGNIVFQFLTKTHSDQFKTLLTT